MKIQGDLETLYREVPPQVSFIKPEVSTAVDESRWLAQNYLVGVPAQGSIAAA